MAITKPDPPIATDIPTIKVILYHSLPTADNPNVSQGVDYLLVVTDQHGMRYRFPQEQGNALPHITQTDTDYFLGFIARFRASAETAVLA